MTPITLHELQSLNRECTAIYCRYKAIADPASEEAMYAAAVYLETSNRFNLMMIEYCLQQGFSIPAELSADTTEVSNAVN